MKGFETPKHFITFPPLFITFSPFSAKSAKVGAVEEWAVNGRCRCFCFVRTLHHSGAVISVGGFRFSSVVGVSVASTSTANHSHGFNTRQRWHSRPFGGVVVHLLGVGSLAVLLPFVALPFPQPTDKKPTKGAKFPSTPLFRTRWAVAPPRSLACRVGSLSASCRCHPLRLEGVGFLVVNGLKGRGFEASSRWGGSRVSPYSLALSSRVSAWVVNLPLNRLIASCFFASTIFA